MINSLFKLLNKYHINKNDSIRLGNSILNNHLIVKFNYIPENLEQTIDGLKFKSDFSWNIDLQDKTNMAMLHLHAWEPVNYLLLAHYYTSNKEYIRKAIEIIDSWYEHSLTATHKYLYYPHCVSDRALIISYLIEINDSHLNSKYMEDLVNKHRLYLVEENNYVKFNHGTMMDRALITLSIVTLDKNTLDFSIKRIHNNILNTFTENMICVENSFTYSVFNLELIISTQKYLLEKKDLTLFNDFEKKIIKALDFLESVKKPNGTFPLYGDGELISVTSLKKTVLYKFYPNHCLFSDHSKSTDKIESFYYKREGYLILKNHQFHFFIRTGDIEKNHKHADDLSFSLFIDKDIFVDPGTYNYDVGPTRNYLKSSYAHNSIVLNYENYNYIKSKNSDVFIDTFLETEDFFYIQLINKSYNFSIIKRNFFILKNDYTVIIVDDISSPISVKYTQTFNLAPNFKNLFKVRYLSNNKININNTLLIESKEIDDIELVYNDHTIYSEKFQQAESIPRLELNKLDKNGTLVTVISKNVSNNILDNLKYDSDSIDFLYQNKHFSHPLSIIKENISINKYINIIHVDGLSIVETYFNIFESQEYAWYIYKDDIREDIIWYQESSVFKYQFKKPGEYKIRCFIRNSENKDEKREFSVKKYIN